MSLAGLLPLPAAVPVHALAARSASVPHVTPVAPLMHLPASLPPASRTQAVSSTFAPTPHVQPVAPLMHPSASVPPASRAQVVTSAVAFAPSPLPLPFGLPGGWTAPPLIDQFAAPQAGVSAVPGLSPPLPPSPPSPSRASPPGSLQAGPSSLRSGSTLPPPLVASPAPPSAVEAAQSQTRSVDQQWVGGAGASYLCRAAPPPQGASCVSSPHPLTAAPPAPAGGAPT